jgi:hypothetical protein
VIKSGYPLDQLSEFPLEAVKRLREHSVTTAEEFLGLANAARDSLVRLLQTTPQNLRSLESAAENVVSNFDRDKIAQAASRDTSQYGLGHDTP